jgi:hypothetical protein
VQRRSLQHTVASASPIVVLFVLGSKGVAEVWYGARKAERIYVASSLTRIALLVAQLLRAMRVEVEGIAVSLSLESKRLPLCRCRGFCAVLL